MRFLADENVAGLVIERLRNEGHDVISIAETTPGSPDDDILKAADAAGRILITEDRDFGEMVIRQRLGPQGVILLELDRLTNATEADAVAEVVFRHAERLAGNLVVVEPAASGSGLCVREMLAPPAGYIDTCSRSPARFCR